MLQKPAEALRANAPRNHPAFAREGTVDDCRFSLAVAEPFVICEEKSLVFADRSTKRPAELVLLQGLRLRREIVRGVKNIVAEEFPERSVESVSTGTSDDIGGRTQSVSELGIGIVSKNSELSDGIHRRFENESSIHAVEIVRSVNQKIVGLGALAIHGVGLSCAQ